MAISISSETYNKDFYNWAMAQAALLRSGQLEQIDVEHIAEEIESMGKSEKRELSSRLVLLIAHLLKWQYQPSHRGRSWLLTIKEQRREIPDCLADNPSFNAMLDEVTVAAYSKAKLLASDETDLPMQTFPEKIPWSFAQILDYSFLPEKDVD